MFGMPIARANHAPTPMVPIHRGHNERPSDNHGFVSPPESAPHHGAKTSLSTLRSARQQPRGSDGASVSTFSLAPPKNDTALGTSRRRMSLQNGLTPVDSQWPGSTHKQSLMQRRMSTGAQANYGDSSDIFTSQIVQPTQTQIASHGTFASDSAPRRVARRSSAGCGAEGRSVAGDPGRTKASRHSSTGASASSQADTVQNGRVDSPRRVRGDRKQRVSRRASTGAGSTHTMQPSAEPSNAEYSVLSSQQQQVGKGVRRKVSRRASTGAGPGNTKSVQGESTSVAIVGAGSTPPGMVSRKASRRASTGASPNDGMSLQGESPSVAPSSATTHSAERSRRTVSRRASTGAGTNGIVSPRETSTRSTGQLSRRLRPSRVRPPGMASTQHSGTSGTSRSQRSTSSRTRLRSQKQSAELHDDTSASGSFAYSEGASETRSRGGASRQSNGSRESRKKLSKAIGHTPTEDHVELSEHSSIVSNMTPIHSPIKSSRSMRMSAVASPMKSVSDTSGLKKMQRRSSNGGETREKQRRPKEQVEYDLEPSDNQKVMGRRRKDPLNSRSAHDSRPRRRPSASGSSVQMPSASSHAAFGRRSLSASRGIQRHHTASSLDMRSSHNRTTEAAIWQGVDHDFGGNDSFMTLPLDDGVSPVSVSGNDSSTTKRKDKVSGRSRQKEVVTVKARSRRASIF